MIVNNVLCDESGDARRLGRLRWHSVLSALYGAVLTLLLAAGVGVPLPAHAASPCGDAGQRSCCQSDNRPTCNVGMVERPGCNGNSCACGGNNVFNMQQSHGTCVKVALPNPGQPAPSINANSKPNTQGDPGCAQQQQKLDSDQAAVNVDNQRLIQQLTQNQGKEATIAQQRAQLAQQCTVVKR